MPADADAEETAWGTGAYGGQNRILTGQETGLGPSAKPVLPSAQSQSRQDRLRHRPAVVDVETRLRQRDCESSCSEVEFPVIYRVGRSSIEMRSDEGRR